MSTPLFIPGQRWVSTTESEAGLGIVIESAHRRVTISFPAIGEQRTYAADNAPLSRVQYNEGDSIRDSEDRNLIVVEILQEAGRYGYRCTDSNGDTHIVDELDLDSFVQFSKPQDRLFLGQIDSLSKFNLRRQTLEHHRRLQQSQTLGLQGARVQLLPHQFYIASEVANRHAPRVLLADEVGLGKTIEAGLIAHQQLTTGKINRVLIVVPDSLVHQWLVEMLRRFNLHFTILDAQRCTDLTAADNNDELDFLDDNDQAPNHFNSTNPFETAQLVLCSLSFLSQNQQRQQQACNAEWDMLIVDEAHHLLWSETQTSPEYQCIETLADKIPSLLLLTATPEQLGIESHFARLRLLDPARYHNIDLFKEEELNYQHISNIVEQLMADNAEEQLLSPSALTKQLHAYLGDYRLAQIQQQLANADNDSAEIIRQLMRNLLDRHGTGRVLFRNTRDAVAGFPQRQLLTYPLPVPADYLAAAEDLDVTDVDAELEQLLHPETLLGSQWLATDPRVPWLVNWLGKLVDDEGWPEQALIICAKASTAQQLEDHLNLRHGIRSAVFHEGLSLVARDRAAAYFADEDDPAQVLVCSEIGSEGRNFQFAHHIVLFDLPLNPDLLEQRIGRLDRIGQRQTVNIHVPHFDQGAQQRLTHWYHHGLNAFERVCPVGTTIFDEVQQPLYAGLLGDDSPKEFAQLVEKTATLTEAALNNLQQGRNKLLELSSCNTDRADELLADVSNEANPQILSEYMEKAFDQFGVDHNYHSNNALVLKASDHLQCESFPGLLDDGMTVTFNRSKALSREDMHFLSWEHPMVSGVMEMISGGDFGNAALCTLKLPPLKPGMLLLECYYLLHCPAPKRLQIHRFLPAVSLRIVIDNNGKDFSHIIKSKHFDKLGKKIAKGAVHGLISHARPQLTIMLKQASGISEKRANEEDYIQQAINKMERHQQDEIERLTALAKINPNIRQSEIEYLEQASVELRNTLSKAEWRLDSLRVGITV